MKSSFCSELSELTPIFSISFDGDRGDVSRGHSRSPTFAGSSVRLLGKGLNRRRLGFLVGVDGIEPDSALQ